ncbi:MAG: DNA repair protein RadA [Candidatus Falkowbacteria bacterium]|nr:MAG: DNA repair protein RadA [Candidatus Falkowbacteria bacterium]
MPAIKSIFICANCDAQFPKWNGRCLECGAWGTLSEQVVDSHQEKAAEAKKAGAANVLDLRTIKAGTLKRLSTGLEEVDRVLGGGLVPGSLVLLSGEPGIGKSTLVAQIAGGPVSKLAVIYASGEESAAQVKSRLDRLNCNLDNLKFISETNVEKIVAAAKNAKPDILIVDSIQTVYSNQVISEAGGISQIRATAVKFLELAKENDIAVLLIGHITKDGQIAGPKSLEHIVDTVLSLEAETSHNYSLLRSTKNRFGSVNELGVLEMTGLGFKEVKNPGAVFIETESGDISGSVLGCVIEGTRPFMIDLQALVSKTAFGYPQRKASGFDLNRLQVLGAVISKRTKVNLLAQDIILNVAGGLRIADPALDLAAVAAIMSSYLNKPFKRDTIVLGEVGLGGEVRNIFRLEERLKEAERLGFKAALVPNADVKAGKLKLIKIKNLDELLEFIK